MLIINTHSIFPDCNAVPMLVIPKKVISERGKRKAAIVCPYSFTLLASLTRAEIKIPHHTPINSSETTTAGRKREVTDSIAKNK